MRAKPEEFQGLAILLKDVWGFSLDGGQKLAADNR
jgi:hypothetical protein